MALVTLLCLVFYFVLPNDVDAIIYKKINGVILLFPALILVWYTVETYFLRIISRQQLDLSIMPSIVMNKSEDEDSFKIINVGNGVAVNIEFDDTILSDKLDIKLRCPKILSLLPGHSALINVQSIRGNRSIDFPYFANIDRHYATQQYEITVTFQDITRQKYSQIIRLGIDGPYVGKISRI